MSRANPGQQNLRDLLDAIRLVLGLDPIYKQVQTTYFSIEMTVDPVARASQEWFVAGGAMPDETRSRDASVQKAMKKRSGAHVRPNHYEKRTPHTIEGIHPRKNYPKLDFREKAER